MDILLVIVKCIIDDRVRVWRDDYDDNINVTSYYYCYIVFVLSVQHATTVAGRQVHCRRGTRVRRPV
jgi:hypothetical protein